MNLQPRRVDKLYGLDCFLPEAWMENWADGLFASLSESIWRMELPNESYLAPRAAFWFVSNERTA